MRRGEIEWMVEGNKRMSGIVGTIETVVTVVTVVTI